MTRVAILAVTLSIAATAQILSIEMTFTGVGCVPCVDSMPTRAKRIRGVESVAVDAEKGILAVTLANPNRVRVEQIRDLIEQDGTKAVRAKIVATGALELQEDGKSWQLRIPQLPFPLRLTASDTANWKAAKTVRIQGLIEDLKEQPPLQVRVTEVKEP